MGMDSSQTLPAKPSGEGLNDPSPDEPRSPFGFRFDYTPPPGGYAWWYIDGVSDDGQNAIVIIIFVGSVFSPYYAWRGFRDPADHCAINVALYGHPQRWSMTERGSDDTERTKDTYSTGNSQVRLTREGLEIEFDEVGAPLPRRVRGRVKVAMPYCSDQQFQLDQNARHFWSPACTHARISVDFEKPGLSWQGHGYVDSNLGLEPVAKGFDYWDWSRTPRETGDILIRYVTDPVGGDQRMLHLQISPDGRAREVDGGTEVMLSPSATWRVKRRSGTLNGRAPRVVRSLEDTPFYSRSLLDYGVGTSGYTTHETLSCQRLRSPIVQAMLPFRMPRLSL